VAKSWQLNRYQMGIVLAFVLDLLKNYYGMFQNYFKIAWRQLVRNKLHTGINLGGLVIGFTISIAILMIVYNQFSYDKFHVNRKRLYEVYQVFNHPDGRVYENELGLSEAPVYKAEAPGVERSTRILDGGDHILYKGRDMSIPVMLVDSDYFSMFSFPIVKGNAGNPLQSLTDIVLREDAAKQIFGNEDPIRKTIKASVGGTLQDLVVSAVIKDGVATSLNYPALARIEHINGFDSKTSWGNRTLFAYVELKPGVSQRQAEQQLKIVDRKYAPDWYANMVKEGAKPDPYGDLWATRLLPMNEVRFSTEVNGHKAMSMGQLLALEAVALFILLIACFNFVNIGLANAFTRSREMGVRKCLGAGKGKLFLQLWGESLLVCGIAFGLSLLLVDMLLHSIDGIDKIRIALSGVMEQPGFLLLAIALLLAVSLIAGGYPSLMMTRFPIIETLKGQLGIKRKSPLRSSLIVLQFMISCVMISCTLIVYQQFQYLQQANTGIDKDHIISVPLHQPNKGRETLARLRTMLASDPHIRYVTGSNINLGRGSDRRTVKVGSEFTYHNRKINTTIASVDYDYLKTLGIRPTEGREFDPGYGADTADRVLVSESMAKQLGEKELIGKIIGDDSSGWHWHVIGVFPDFHLYTLAEEVQPLTLVLEPHSPIMYCFVKTTGNDPAAAMASIKKAMAVLEPGQEFNGSFVDDNINDWYSAEKVMSLSFGIAAAISILLSCSGLLAMVLLIIQQRVKEIGVRKVLGASVRSIALLVSREFVWLVGLAVLIATPIAWWAMKKWLDSFPYRIQIRVWMFVLVGFTAVALSLLTIAINTIRRPAEPGKEPTNGVAERSESYEGGKARNDALTIFRR
jgi:putative ABC transport system permease protein